MVDLANSLTQTGILLESDILLTVGGSYFFLLCILFISFVNIYSVDKYEFLNNTQSCFDAKYKLPFIIQYSKNKYVISRKTFRMELIGYSVLLVMIVLLCVSLFVSPKTAVVLLGVSSLIVLIFGCITGDQYRKTKKKK